MGTILGKAEFSDQLKRLEQQMRLENRVDLRDLLSLRCSAEYWAEQTSQARNLRRLAQLMKRAGDRAEAIGLLQAGCALCPDDPRTAYQLCELLTANGRLPEALAVVQPHACAPGAEAEVLAIAARLHQQVGDSNESLRLHGEAARKDPAFEAQFLEALSKSGQRERALLEADRISAARPDDPKTCFACYSAYLSLGADIERVMDARFRLFKHADNDGRGWFWRARAFRREGDMDAGFAELCAAADLGGSDLSLVKERAVFALALGHWARDARYLLDAKRLAGRAPVLEQDIARADLLLRACGGSLEEAAAFPSAFAHVRAPESVFEMVAGMPAVAQSDTGRAGLVMVVGSLAGGGAERVLANTFRQLNSEGRFDWMKLYVCDLAHQTAKDFYLPLTGLARADVVVLDQECEVEEPLCWLGRARAQQAQRILTRLRLDRPAIVHASLEPLNLLAGLSAILAGVPRIVLHTHNMRPTNLAMRDAPRMRDCYRALLTRDEVSLVGCAQASVEDYADWLNLDGTSSTFAVHNGFDVGQIVATSNSVSRAELRALHGIEPDADVVGTAFRFATVKQPLLWVDAAAQVLAERPNCRFVMFGDGDLKAATEDHICAKGLSDHFILPGRVTDIYSRLPLLDLFVLSSRSEALPNVLLEAQATGVPVVAFDVGGIAEAMIDGVTGFLVRDHSAAGLAAGILRALGDQEWRRRAPAAAKEFVLENFSIDRMVHRLSDILLRSGRSDRRRAAPIPTRGGHEVQARPAA